MAITYRKPKANIHIILELLLSFHFKAITDMQTILSSSKLG